jgi:hypothetical protein
VHRAIWVPAQLLALAAVCSSGAPQVPAILRSLTMSLSVATTMHTCSACMRRGTGFPPTGVSRLRNPRRQPGGSPRLLQAIRLLQRRPSSNRVRQVLTIQVCTMEEPGRTTGAYSPQLGNLLRLMVTESTWFNPGCQIGGFL